MRPQATPPLISKAQVYVYECVNSRRSHCQCVPCVLPDALLDGSQLKTEFFFEAIDDEVRRVMQARRCRRSRHHPRRVSAGERVQVQLEEFQLPQRLPLRNPWIASDSSSSASLSTTSRKCIHQRIAPPPPPLTAQAPPPPPPQIQIIYQRDPTSSRDPIRGQYCSLLLQSVLVGGALTGIALIISGITLDTQYGGKLIVLVYIGGLLSVVSVILLVIHCCVAIRNHPLSPSAV